MSKVRRTGEAFTVLRNGHVISYGGLVARRVLRWAFIVNKCSGCNIDEYYSIYEMVCVLVIRLNKGRNSGGTGPCTHIQQRQPAS